VNWGVLAADFRREYSITPAELWAMPVPEFVMYVAGLSADARFRGAYQETPRTVTDPAEIARLTGLPA
jgi:hypothetical protein